MSALLASRLYNNDYEITTDYVRELLDEGVKKGDFITFIIEFISKFSLTNNLWLLSQIKEYLNSIESTKQNDRKLMSQHYVELLNLLANIPKQKYIFCDGNDKQTISKSDMNTVILDVNFSVVEDDLLSLSHVVTSDIHKLLIVLYSGITRSNNLPKEENIRKCFLIIRYLLTLQPKTYLQVKGNKIDIVDILFIVLILFSGSIYCTRMLQQYINISKDIFYLRTTKQKKWERINIIFYIVYMIIFDDLENVECEIKKHIEDTLENIALSNTVYADEGINNGGEPSDVNDVRTKCKHLYFYSEYDEPLALQVKFEKERNKLKSTYRPSYKEIDVAWTINNEKEFIYVYKHGRDAFPKD
jgi:hypothetical protein